MRHDYLIMNDLCQVTGRICILTAMATSAALRDRTVRTILDAAAAILAERGGNASMADIAEAAGVGRATVYRYFPTRDALLDALCEAGTAELSRVLGKADLDRIAVPEGLARVARALIGLGSKYAALMPTGALGPLGQQVADRNKVDPRQLIEPVHALLRRGVAEGVLRDDLTTETLWGMLEGLLDAASERVTEDHTGIEQASADAVSVFLYGTARNTPQAHRRPGPGLSPLSKGDR